MKIKNIFEEGDTVLLSDTERYTHPEVYPIGKVVRAPNRNDLFFIQWESREESAVFNKDGIIGTTLFNNGRKLMSEVVINYGQINDKEILALRLKL